MLLNPRDTGGWTLTNRGIGEDIGFSIFNGDVNGDVNMISDSLCSKG